MASHPNLLERDNTVLVVVDVQEPFRKSVFERDRVITNVIKLVEAAKVLGLPVIATLQNRARMGDLIPEVASVLPGSTGEGVLHPPIDKMTFSCCGVEAFRAAVERIERNTVLLCGVETHICVNQTAHDLAALGYRVHVAADAVSSRRESDWQIGLEKMRQSGVIVTSTEAAIFELLKDAAAPEFKAILELVK